ncbi:tetratricopeptide repeat protein [Paraliomyxa miuraensis]|uniref:tetratricopeptide repeat protein n=1 Tax=Paraliomyxa miuraensis TaxID=376150 RepID=UPI002258DE25|nr:tetratricopeptide repeat protein [Paraliomyxa miuraensis]MCX4242762.1 tetratricopeptide repeat protein [Paraliomyxa miuraensis]
MMPRPTDRPLARAQAHLSAGRHAEAIGAFRAALGIDPSDMRARMGLVKALVARGRRSDAAEGLVATARDCVARRELDLALDLLGRALQLDPHRLELHVDVAMVERSLGRTEQALMRIESLAEHYMSTGRTEDAAGLLRFAASWDEPIVVAAPIVEAVPIVEAAPAAVRAAPTAPMRTKAPRRLPERRQPAPRRATPRVDDNDQTVARAVPRRAIEEIDVDMVTRVARVPERPARPVRPVVTTKPSLVDRLRSRAGLSHEGDAPTVRLKARRAQDRPSRAPERDDEVTVLFRRPEDLRHAIAY